MNTFRQHWMLNPEVDFLNHGSFGATPRKVLQAQHALQLELERDPIEFLAPERNLLPKLEGVRQVIAQLVQVDAADLAFVRNSTEGVNAVMRSYPWQPGDEVIITNHGYNACNNAVRFATAGAGAVAVEAAIPFPLNSPDQILDAVQAAISPRTRLLLIDHVTSPTGLVFPIDDLVDLAHQHHVRVMIDGSHAPGMLPLDLRRTNADYYTANHHKWLCGPKSSGFLYVRPEYQPEVRPVAISHGANTPQPGRSRFLTEFDWTGTFDPTPLLAMPVAVEFLRSLHDGGLPALMTANRTLALEARQLLVEALGLAQPAPAEMLGSLASIPLQGLESADHSAVAHLKRRLFDDYRIEVPIFLFDRRTPCLRISAQAYNSRDQYQRLATILPRLLP